jgi:phage-related protein
VSKVDPIGSKVTECGNVAEFWRLTNRKSVPLLVRSTVTYVGKLPRDVRFFATDTGNEPAREWLKGLSKEERTIIGEDLFTVQNLEIWKEPLVKNLGDGLWEVRSTLPNGIARIIFSICSGEMIVLNGFIKKSQKTPDHELDLALQRKRTYERNKKSTQGKQS